MWEKVATRQHTPIQIFPFGSGSEELMLHGTVAYVLKDGKRAQVDWAAKADMVKEDEKWKLKFYQVYLGKCIGLLVEDGRADEYRYCWPGKRKVKISQAKV